MKTGKDVSKAGLYVSECCLQERHFETDDAFSRCPKCLRLTEWEPVDVVSVQAVANVNANDNYEAA
jgi:hypothetical protein